MKTQNIILVIVLSLTLLASTSSISQNLITGSTTWGSEVSVKPEEGVTVGDLIGSRRIEFGPMVLDGKKNCVKLDVSAFSATIDADSGAGSVEADLRVFKLQVASEGQDRRHWVGVSGTLGPRSVRIELDFSPGMAAITGTAARSSSDTPYRIVITDDLNGSQKVITGSSRELKWWQ